MDCRVLRCDGSYLVQSLFILLYLVEVKLHPYLEGTPNEKEFFVEMWDIGGSHSQRNPRHVFMHTCHGIVLVHDLTNRKSCLNLDTWLAEVMRAEAGSTKYSGAWDGAATDVGEVRKMVLNLHSE